MKSKLTYRGIPYTINKKGVKMKETNTVVCYRGIPYLLKVFDGKSTCKAFKLTYRGTTTETNISSGIPSLPCLP